MLLGPHLLLVPCPAASNMSACSLSELLRCSYDRPSLHVTAQGWHQWHCSQCLLSLDLTQPHFALKKHLSHELSSAAVLLRRETISSTAVPQNILFCRCRCLTVSCACPTRLVAVLPWQQVSLASCLANSRCTCRNHAASARVLAGIVIDLSPHHVCEQDVAGSSAYMRKCE